MPTPRVVQREIDFNGGQSILDPPTDTHPPISAARAWQIATRFGLLVPPRHGTYQLLLGDLTSIQHILHRPVWVVVGHNVPTVPFGGPARRPDDTTSRPPCYFANTVQPIDATTGKSLFYTSGGSDPVP